MNIRDYKYIVAIAEFNGISKAADYLYITQSALTKFLQRVEAELDTQLFIRSGKTFYPTDAGQCYIEKAREIIRLDEELTREIAYIIDDSNKRIRLGCPTGRADVMIKDVLPVFYNKYPDVTVGCGFTSMAEQLKLLSEKKLDLAFGSVHNHDNAYQYIQLGTTRFVLVVLKQSPLIEKAAVQEGFPYPVIRKDDWVAEPFIMLPMATGSGSMVNEYLAKEKIEPNIRLYTSDVRTSMLAVEQGLGISIMWTPAKETEAVAYLSLQEIGTPQQNLYIAVRKDHKLTKPEKELVEILRKMN